MKNKKVSPNRKFLPTLSDLIDTLTITQIKELRFKESKFVYADEIKKICHDIDLLINEKNLKLNARLILIIIIIAQLNLYIWENKEKMKNKKNEVYLKLLKLAHQLNGIRNRMKNKLLEEIGDNDTAKKRTNVDTDDLEGWDVSVD